MTGFDTRTHMVTMTTTYADGGTKLARGSRLVTYPIVDFSKNFNAFVDTKGTAVGKVAEGD